MCKIDKELKKAIKDKKIVIFAGAGISKELGIPSWDVFTNNVLQQLKNDVRLEKKERIQYENLLESKEDCFAKLEKIKKGLARETALQYISKAFKIPANRKCYIQERLLDISGKIITTNFDNAFERAYEIGHAGDLPLVALGTTENSNLLTKLTKCMKNNNDFIYKIHGCVSNPDSCIVFRDRYEEFYEGIKGDKYYLARSILEQFCRDYHIIFIGWSFDDMYVRTLFERQCEKLYGQHYIVTTESNKYTADEFSFLKVIPVNDYSNESMDKLYDTLEACVHKTPIQKLRKMDIFHNMARKSLEVIAGESQIKLKKDEPLSHEGDDSSVFWVILDGTITANKNISTIDKNDIIGELGFVLRSPRTRNIFCSSKTAKVIPITQKTLTRISKEDQEKLWKNIVCSYFKRIAKNRLSSEKKQNLSWEDIAKIFSNNFREENYDIDNLEYYLLRFINDMQR